MADLEPSRINFSVRYHREFHSTSRRIILYSCTDPHIGCMSAARPIAAQQPPPGSDNAETPLSRLKAALGYAFKRPKEGEEVCMCCTTATIGRHASHGKTERLAGCSLQTPPPPPELVDWAQNTAIAALAGSAVSGGRSYLRERQQAGTQQAAHNSLSLHAHGPPQPAG